MKIWFKTAYTRIHSIFGKVSVQGSSVYDVKRSDFGGVQNIQLTIKGTFVISSCYCNVLLRFDTQKCEKKDFVNQE